MRAAACLIASLLGPAAASAGPACAGDKAAAPALRHLREAMAQGRFVAYEPTSLRVINGHSTTAAPASIRADLRVLRPYFDALLTYGALHGAEAIPALAAEQRFRAIVIGVWDPFDDAEIDAALAAARSRPGLVVGVAIGNEWLFAKRPRAAELPARIAALRVRARGVPLATAEPFHVFYADDTAPLLAQLDFLLPIIHPVFQPWFPGAPAGNAADFVVRVTARLAGRFCGPILVKETGVPSAPSDSGFDEARQTAFYGELARRFEPTRDRAFAYFAAFDAPWRVADQQAVAGHHPEEAHWGLFDADRHPKPAVAAIPPLAQRYTR